MFIAFESLNYFTLHNPIRIKVLKLVEHKYFDIFTMSLILLNSIFLGLYDYTDKDGKFWGNKLVDKSEFFFTAVFTMECILKIIAYGFLMSEGCYL